MACCNEIYYFQFLRYKFQEFRRCYTGVRGEKIKPLSLNFSLSLAYTLCVILCNEDNPKRGSSVVMCKIENLLTCVIFFLLFCSLLL